MTAVTDIAAALGQWYADQSSIRRLWALEDPPALVVLVALEPTSTPFTSQPQTLTLEEYMKQRKAANQVKVEKKAAPATTGTAPDPKSPKSIWT